MHTYIQYQSFSMRYGTTNDMLPDLVTPLDYLAALTDCMYRCLQAHTLRAVHTSCNNSGVALL